MRCRILVQNRTMHTGQRDERRFADAGVQVDPGSLDPMRETTQSRLHRWILPSLGVLILCIFIQTTGWWEGYAFRYALGHLRKNGWNPYPVDNRGGSGVAVFDLHDIDDDGFLSPEEFEPLAQRLVVPFNDTTISYDRNISSSDEIVTLDVKFQPLKLETLTKDLSVKTDGLNSLSGLRQWTDPVKRWQNFGASDFHSFLPRVEADRGSVGRVYRIFESSRERGPSLSSERYLPPKLDTEAEKMVHRLLALFHPLPFVHTRFAPKGSTAVVRAYNDVYIDIVFRIHAEFQLNRPPFYPCWFTPAQFKGHVTMSRDASRVLDFHLYVPNDKRLNVDMEWLTGSQESGNMEVDIGYMPQMELQSTAESIPGVLDGVDWRDGYVPTRPEEESRTNVVWTEEMSVAEAERLLEVEMYPFKQVTYHNFTDAMREATRVNRPIHSILLWGCLDDQSC